MRVVGDNRVRIGGTEVEAPGASRYRPFEEIMVLEPRQQLDVDFPGASAGTVLVVRHSKLHARDVVDHDVAGTGVEGHHLAAVSVGELAIGNPPNVEGENRANVAERDIIEILHQRCTGATKGMVHGAELGDDRYLAGF